MRIVLDADQGVMISVYIYDGYSINPQSMYCVGFDDDKKKTTLLHVMPAWLLWLYEMNLASHVKL
jgi:hypothetical protein